MVSVVNTTFTFNLNAELDLESLARQLWDVEYNPKKFSSLVMRLRDPLSTALLYRSGIVVLVGCRSWRDAKRAAHRTAKRVRRLVPDVRVSGLALKNMVGAGKHDFNLNGHLHSCSSTTFHDNEIFPGMNIDLRCGLKATLFAKGTFFITGAKCESDLEAGHLELMLKFYFN